MPDSYYHLSDGYTDAVFRSAPRTRERLESKASLKHMDGRSYPLAYFPKWIDQSIECEFLVDTVVDGDQWVNLRTLIENGGLLGGGLLTYSDPFGESFACVVTADEATRQVLLSGATPARFQTVGFTVRRVDEGGSP